MKCRVWGVLVGGLVILAAVAACSSPNHEQAQSQDTSGPTLSIDTPGFTGSWAQEFEQAFSKASTDLGRQVLADEAITDAEIAELKQAYVGCLENLGFTNVVIGQGGQMQVSAPQGVEGQQAVDSLVEQCGRDTDWDSVSMLQSLVAGNPENADTYAIMAECLVRTGLRQDGYTAEDYLQEFEGTAFDNLDASTPEGQKFIACNLDPAHAK